LEDLLNGRCHRRLATVVRAAFASPRAPRNRLTRARAEARDGGCDRIWPM